MRNPPDNALYERIYEVVAQVPRGRAFSFENELLAPMLGTLRPAAFAADGLFIDIGVPEDYALAQRLFAARGG